MGALPLRHRTPLATSRQPCLRSLSAPCFLLIKSLLCPFWKGVYMDVIGSISVAYILTGRCLEGAVICLKGATGLHMLTQASTTDASAAQKDSPLDGTKRNKKVQKNRHRCGGCVICTRFELVTSCLSSKRSKPTELTDHLPYENGCKSTHFFQSDKKKLKKVVSLHHAKMAFSAIES